MFGSVGSSAKAKSRAFCQGGAKEFPKDVRAGSTEAFCQRGCQEVGLLDGGEQVYII